MGLPLSSVMSPSDIFTLGPAEGDNLDREPLSKTGAGLEGLGGN